MNASQATNLIHAARAMAELLDYTSDLSGDAEAYLWNQASTPTPIKEVSKVVRETMFVMALTLLTGSKQLLSLTPVRITSLSPGQVLICEHKAGLDFHGTNAFVVKSAPFTRGNHFAVTLDHVDGEVVLDQREFDYIFGGSAYVIEAQG